MFQEGEVNYDSEINELQKDGEMSLDELLASLPKEIILGRQKLDLNDTDENISSSEVTNSKKRRR